jgi:putative DNA primase/helicase
MYNAARQSDASSDEFSLLWYATKYFEAGFCLIPVEPRSKKPVNKGWPSLRIPFEDLEHHFYGNRNIGVVLGDASGGLVDIDLDSKEAVILAHHFLPETDCVFGRKTKPGSHWLYRVPLAPRITRRKDQDCIVEVRGTGGHTVFPGSIHEVTGEAIEFSNPIIDDRIPEPAKCNVDLLNWATIRISVGSVLLKNWHTGKRHDLSLAIAGYLARYEWLEDDVSHLIKAVADCAGDEEIDGRLNDVRTTFENYRSGNIISGTEALREALGEDSAKSIAKWVGGPKGETYRTQASANSNNQITSASFSTDADSARTFAEFNSQTVKFCSERDQWFIKREAVFEPVGQSEMQGKVSDLVEHVAKTIPSVELPKAMRSRSRINSTIELARSHNPVSAEAIDQHNHFVGLSDGTILDLATRKNVHREDVFVTKKLATAFDPEARCPAFEVFLDRIFAGNKDVIEFVCRAIGYSLSGETSEQCLFILVGTGANGKSTLLNVLNRLFGDYAGTTPMQTLTASKFNNGQTNDLAAMEGKRFVSASDGEADQKLAVTKIKLMTGGDKIACRALYKDYSTFTPQLKLWVATNDVPDAPGADEALMRRIMIIRFPVVIPVEERDHNLPNNLAEELAGILNWALRGYDDWTRNKLQPPHEVNEATNSYRRDNDPVGQFIEDRCEQVAAARVSTKVLYDNFEGWCSANGHDLIPISEFGKILGRKKFQKKKVSGGLSGWLGLQLNLAEKMKAAC